MASIFTQIIERELPGYIVAEDDKHIAILDINPNTAGHTLCIPKQEVDKIFDLSPSAYSDLMTFSYKVAQALEKAVPCKRVGMSVIGLEVSHVHVHLIPLQSMEDIQFENKAVLTPYEFEALVDQIKRYL